MKKNYNELVRFYNRNLKKLRSLLNAGKNPYKQDILQRRIARLFQQLSGLQNQIKLGQLTAAVVTGAALLQVNTASAQSFPAKVTNPFGITASGSTWTIPSFVDLDNDGDLDMLSGDSGGDFYYYKNIGTASVPNFSAAVMNPYGLTNTGGGYTSPTFVDYDVDGDMDMFSGDVSGDFFWYENTGTASAPVFNAPVTNPDGISTITAGYSIGQFADIDNDGDKDLMAGNQAGDFYYFLNTGTASAPAFAAPSMNPFGLAITGGTYSTIAFADLDGDGDKDLMSGRNNGSFSYYQNTGTSSAPAFAASVLNPFLLTSTGGSGSDAVFADLDNDGDLDLMSGNSAGSFVYYANTGVTGIAKNTIIDGVSIYPNPTSSNVVLHLNNVSEAVSVEVTNTIGQVVTSMNLESAVNTITLPEAKGMYFVKVSTASNKSNVFKIVKE